MRVKFTALLSSVLLLAACATQIHEQEETIKPSKAKFGQYKRVTIKPIDVSAVPGIEDKITARMQEALSKCMGVVFKGAKPYDERAAAGGLVIEPSIVDMKKVNVAQRIFFGAMAGSSAALLKVRFVDSAKKDVLAEPVFYGKANAFGGAYSAGATDNDMLARLPVQACDYSRDNY
jgi:hypothetical protein